MTLTLSMAPGVAALRAEAVAYPHTNFADLPVPKGRAAALGAAAATPAASRCWSHYGAFVAGGHAHIARSHGVMAFN